MLGRRGVDSNAAVGLVVAAARGADTASDAGVAPHVVAHTHVVCYGPLSMYAGMAAGVAGMYEEAEQLLATAVQENERLNAPFLLARSHLSWGRMLQERGRPGDAERAAEHLEASLALARRHGAGWVEQQACALLARRTASSGLT